MENHYQAFHLTAGTNLHINKNNMRNINLRYLSNAMMTRWKDKQFLSECNQMNHQTKLYEFIPTGSLLIHYDGDA